LTLNQDIYTFTNQVDIPIRVSADRLSNIVCDVTPGCMSFLSCSNYEHNIIFRVSEGGPHRRGIGAHKSYPIRPSQLLPDVTNYIVQGIYLFLLY